MRSASVEFLLSARALERSLEGTFQVDVFCSSIETSNAATPPPQPSPASGRGGAPRRVDGLRVISHAFGDGAARSKLLAASRVRSLSRLRGGVRVGGLASGGM